MKSLFIIIVCLIGLKGFSQTSDLIVQEKSSDWVTVTSTTPVSKPTRPTAIKRKTSPKRTTAPKRDAQEEFDKTNSQVNRFKKGKKD
jgi:hypothetical protein